MNISSEILFHAFDQSDSYKLAQLILFNHVLIGMLVPQHTLLQSVYCYLCKPFPHLFSFSSSQECHKLWSFSWFWLILKSCCSKNHLSLMYLVMTTAVCSIQCWCMYFPLPTCFYKDFTPNWIDCFSCSNQTRFPFTCITSIKWNMRFWHLSDLCSKTLNKC